MSPPADRLARRIFVAIVGVAFFYAFLSLGAQIEGLIGENGILPAQQFLAAVEQNLGGDRFLRVPTLFWWVPATDAVLVGVCTLGAVVALLLIFGRFERPAVAICGVLYLSVAGVGRDFLWFQWDILLVEVSVVTFLLVPTNRVTHRAAMWLARLLLFKLMFSSGFVKLSSGDPTWRDLTALLFHYETQPLPTALAWYAHQLPAWFHRVSVALTFVIQLVVPFGLFAPRKIRFVAAAILIAHQLLIALTGNYCFFNLLAIGLCVLVFDDAAIRSVLPRSWSALYRSPIGAPSRAVMIGAIIVFALNIMPFTELLFGYGALPTGLDPVLMKIRPFRAVNGYGLFAVMTTTRPEIVIEGSHDGVTWQAYELPAKPGALDRAPPWVAPHQPRVDWQLWFAALGERRQNPWLTSMLSRLLEGSPQVLTLFLHDPFGGQPPRFIRAKLYRYHFTDPDERARTGRWWSRIDAGMYFPAFSL